MAGVNALNRMIVVMLGIALVAAGIITLLVTTGAVGTGALASSGWFREQFQHLNSLTGSDETIAIAAGAVAIGVGLMLALTETLPLLLGNRELYVRDGSGNRIMISPETLEAMVEQAAINVPGVTGAESSFRQTTNGMLVACSAALQHDVNVVEKSAELDRAIKQRLQDRAGVRVAGVRMTLHLARPEAQAERHSAWGPFHWGRGQSTR